MIFAAKTRIAILRRYNIAPRFPNRPVDTVKRNKRQTVNPNELRHFVNSVFVGKQFLTLGRVNAIEARMRCRGACYPHVDLFRGRRAQHLNDLYRRRTAHNRVIYQNDAFSRDQATIGVVFHFHANLAHSVGRLNECASDVVTENDPQVEWDTALLSVADSGRNARIRNRDYHVRFGRGFLREFHTDIPSDNINSLSFNHRIGTSEINMLEYAKPARSNGERTDAPNCLPIDDNKLTRFNIADEFGTDDIQGARLAREDVAALQSAQYQRTYAVWITHAEHCFRRQAYERISALDLATCGYQFVNRVVALRPRHKVENDFGIRCRMKNAAAPHKLLTKCASIG